MEDYFSLQSDRLYFKPCNIEDASLWEPFFEDNDRLHFLGLDPSKEKKELAIYSFQRQLDRYEKGQLGMLQAYRKSDHQLLGMSGLIPREIEGNKYLEIGYSFIKQYWGQGYATEAAITLKKFGVENKLANEFISIIHKDNFDSMRVADRNGMLPWKKTTYEGMEVVIYKTK